MAIAGTVGVLGGGLLAGCSSGGSEGESTEVISQGFADDCEVKDHAITIWLYADSLLARPATTAGVKDKSRLEQYFSRYQDQTGREQVSFAVKYLSSDQMSRCMTEGFEGGDAAIALEGYVSAGVDSGKLYGGAADTSVRKFTAELYERLVVVKAAGSDAQMPKASTLSGEDSPDGSFNQLQNLAQFQGSIAVAADTTIEGAMANRTLARWGLYSESSGQGGTYADDLSPKMRVFDTTDQVVDALVDNTCQLGFMAESGLASYSQVSKVYLCSGSTLAYAGASIEGATEAGPARDFLEYVTRCV